VDAGPEVSPVVARVSVGSGLEPGVLETGPVVVLDGVLDEDEDEVPSGVAGSSPPQARSATKPATAVANPALTLTVESPTFSFALEPVYHGGPTPARDLPRPLVRQGTQYPRRSRAWGRRCQSLSTFTTSSR